MGWLIGFKGSNLEGEQADIREMLVDVDECSPKEHYLYLYNEFEVDDEEIVQTEGNVAELKPAKYAKVMGVFPPTTWIFAIQEDVLVLAESDPDTGE